VWCRHHWKILAIALWTLVVWFVSRGNVKAYKRVLEATIDNYKKEIEVLENSHADEIGKRNEAIQVHNESIAKLEREYKGSKNDLTVEKRARYLELLEMLNKDPKSANEAIEKEFGFKHVD
jgi:PHP family Zn ribbon phosphoesterase